VRLDVRVQADRGSGLSVGIMSSVWGRRAGVDALAGLASLVKIEPELRGGLDRGLSVPAGHRGGSRTSSGSGVISIDGNS